LVAAAALLASGCGDTHRTATTPLPPGLAKRLRSLEDRPAVLRNVVIREVNAGHVPAELQEELLARANAYAERPTRAHRLSVNDLLRR
jgi:hypothetical protein